MLQHPWLPALLLALLVTTFAGVYFAIHARHIANPPTEAAR